MTGGPLGWTHAALISEVFTAGHIGVAVPAGAPVLTITSPWGLTDAGVPYYQASGAAAADAALLQLNTSGAYYLTKGA